MGKNRLKKELTLQQRDVLCERLPVPNATFSKKLRSCKKQKTKQSIGDAETEVEIDTLSFDNAFSAGLAFEQLKCYDGALESFQRAVNCQPTHMGALTHLADVYSAAGQPREALKCYVKASKLESGKEDASVWFRLGLAHAAIDQQLKATKAYQKSIDINAKALESANDAHEDVKDLRKAYGVTLMALAEAFGELGDLDSAVKVFADAVTRFPNTANMHYNLVNMRMARNESTGDDAFDSVVAQSLERAIKLSPETCDFIEELASYLAKHKQQPDRVCELRRKADELKFAGIAAVAKSDDEHDQEITCGRDKDEDEDVSEDEEIKEKKDEKVYDE
ncbi:unnamed protein product [Peronospora destructor]|uniref:Uncharacterized protein n=1 Tax=Peronospora destructor TaxID=86335 RepID=A0AAV0V642_9STRA|nr:unnamed protein product [Peronospora destructor]